MRVPRPWLAIAGVALAVVSSVSNVGATEYTSVHTEDAIYRAHMDTGVNYDTLRHIVGCETGWTFNPYAEGDGGHSHGAAQLNDYGNAIGAFYRAGYTDPYNPYEAVYFMAESLRGDHPPLGRRTWNC